MIAEVFKEVETEPAGQFFDLPGGQAFLYLRKLPGKETANEDSAGLFALPDKDIVLAVADGMGGTPSGAKASGIVVTQLQKALKASTRGQSDHREDILNGIESANKQILELGVGAGSTAAVLEISRNIVRPYHVGDSEILLVGQRGKLKLQTISHSPVGYGIESGLIGPEEAIYHHERHLISNFLGSQEMRIEIGAAVTMSRYDTLLIASDGVFDNAHLDELIALIRKGPLKQVGKLLTELISMRMQSNTPPCKPDDVGFILYRRT